MEDEKHLPHPDATREKFLSWARTMNPTTTYDYCQVTKCAFAQYLVHLGHEENDISVGPGYFRLYSKDDSEDRHSTTYEIPWSIQKHLNIPDSPSSVYDFGGLVKRIEEDQDVQ